MVASCSSSGEEKEAYAIKFTNTDRIKATIDKTLQPSKLTADQFKAEVLEHKSDLFTIEGTLPSDSFLNDNIKITDLNPSDDKKEVSAKVTVDKANTNGEPIEKTITLTGLGYEEVDLTKLVYTIALKENNTDPQEIELSDQANNSTDTINAEKLMELVLVDATKEKILEVSGDNANQITNEILANQILKVSDLKTDKTEGKVTFKLSVEKPKNGAGDTLEKTIIFTGFKKETDSTPATNYQIAFQDGDSEGKYVLTTVADKTTEDFSDTDTIKTLIISEKEVIFKPAKGELPSDDNWWNDNLQITNTPTADPAKGEITVRIQLNNSDSSDDSQNINKEIILKGFLPKETIPATGETTTPKTEVSTVTLGLNGSLTELQSEVNGDWVIQKKAILFEKGFEPINDAASITGFKYEPVTGNNGAFTLKFTLAENKYYGDDKNLGTTPKEFSILIKGISATATNGTELRNKSAATDSNPLSIALVDPALGEKTYDEYKNESATFFTKSFIFKYRKHLLTGDFTKVDEAGEEGFLSPYSADKFVTIVTNDTAETIQIKFKILKDKLTPAPSADKEYSIVFNGFKPTSN